MRRTCTLNVLGGNSYLILASHLEALQHQGASLGNTLVPILLRLGVPGTVSLQPVTARQLLAEIDGLVDRSRDEHFPAAQFLDQHETRLGEMVAWTAKTTICGDKTTTLLISELGLRVVVQEFPPPVGFRTAPGLARGEHECYFTQLRRQGDGWLGDRTGEMCGTGSPVRLALPPLPQPSRWDFARVVSSETLSSIRHVQIPVSEALSETIHALCSACTDSLRLRHPLRITV